MAVTPLSVTPITRAGVTLTLTPFNADGHTVANPDEKTFVVVENGSDGTVVVSLDIITTIDGQPVTDRTVSIAMGATKLIGPFTKAWYNDGSNNVTLTIDDETDVTCAAFSL